MEQISRKFNIYKNKKFVKYGIPFIIFIVGGSFGFRNFTELRYRYSKQSQLRPDQAEKFGIQMKEVGEVTLETEYEKIKDIHLDDYEMIRGPRPWEEDASS